MIVRELLTLLGFTVDKASYDKASKQYDALTGKLTKPQAQGLGQSAEDAHRLREEAKKTTGSVNMLSDALGMVQRFAAQAGISNLVREWVQMASDVNETTNVLESVFGKDGQKQVEDWSATQAAAMGRSKYSLQQYASQLGAVLGPVTKSQDDARQMSEALAQLSVDLGSFFNTTDEDAMRALRSGLTGEYESLKRYGVVLNDTTLAEVARTRGIKKKVTQMTTAEKTELRFAAIMERTKAAQGDAAKTGEGFANASKAVREALKDLGTDIGKTVLPKVNRLIRFMRDMLNWFNKAAKQSHILEAAMYTLAGVAAILAVEFYSAFVLPALAVGALILVVDELWTTLEGGESILRDVVDGLFGDGTTLEMVNNIKAGIQIIREELKGLDALGVWETFADGVKNAVWAVGQLIKKIIELGDYIPIIWVAKKALRATGAIGPEQEEKSFREQLAERQANQRAEILANVHNRQQRIAEHEREATYGPSSFNMLEAASAARAPAMPFRTPAAAAAAGASPLPVVNNTVINVNGGNTDQVRRTINETLDARDKKTAAAHSRRGRS